MITLAHLTLNTGHLVAAPCPDAAALAPYGAIIASGGGELPGLDGWHAALMFQGDEQGRRIPGAAFMQLADQGGLSQRPVVMGFACWDAPSEADAWVQVMIGYRAQENVLRHVDLWRPPPAKPPALPWLAIWLTPFIGLADHLTLRELGRIEQELAWALIADEARGG